MNTSFRDIEYFIECGACSTFTQAAAKLGIAQPSLTLAIQRLEGELGISLFLRSKNGIRLTKTGERALLAARRSQESFMAIKKMALNEQEEWVGSFTIGAHVSVAHYSFANFLPELMAKYPGIEISLHHGLSRSITDDVVSFRCDFGIVVNPIRHPDLVIQTLFYDEVAYWVSEKLKNPDILLMDPELLQVQSLLKKEKSKFRRHITSSSLEVLRSLAQAGCGVAILPTRVAQEAKLKKWSKTAPVFRDQICLVYRYDYQNTRAAKMVASEILKALKSR